LKIGMNDGSAGWIPTRYVRPVSRERATPGDAASGPSPMAVVTTTRANVRFGAGLNFKVRYTEEAGVRVPVVDATGEWFKVRTPDGELGWLHQSVVRVAGGNG
jgi:SH3-like domain-containing protein